MAAARHVRPMKQIAKSIRRYGWLVGIGVLLAVFVAALAIPPLRERLERLYDQIFRAEELAASDAYERTRGRDDLATLGGWVGGLPPLPADYTIWAVSHDALSGAVYVNVDAADGITLMFTRYSYAAADDAHNALPATVLQDRVDIQRESGAALVATFIRGDWSGTAWDAALPVTRLRWGDNHAAYEITAYAVVEVQRLGALAVAISPR